MSKKRYIRIHTDIHLPPLCSVPIWKSEKKVEFFMWYKNCKIGHTLHTKLVAFWCVLNLVKNAAKFNDLWCVPTPPKSRIIPSIFFSFEKRTQCTLIDLLVDQFWQAHCVYIWILKCRTSKKQSIYITPFHLSLQFYLSISLILSVYKWILSI